MNRTKIEWTDWTWNPITGCLNNCEYCYAMKLLKRFEKVWGYGTKPTFHPDRLYEPDNVKKPSKIFVCSMAELFANWIQTGWIDSVFNTIKRNPHHTFQLLTKFPELAIGWGYPDNVWLGTTIERQCFEERLTHLKNTKARIKFVSFEPLLEEINLPFDGVDWIIIGSQTQPLKIPDKEWVEKLIEQARDLDIPIFLKDNLYWFKTIQEFPE